MSERAKRVLFVSYAFPPTGGVGVQRVTKFTKYLPEFGWECSVLTASNPSVPLFDESLCDEVPESTIVRRAKTFEPSYSVKNAISASRGRSTGMHRISSFAKSIVRKAAGIVLEPDAQVLWHRHARREGLALLGEVPHDVIVATGPPFSSFLLGAQLSRATGLPLVLDYRDEWDISNTHWENRRPGAIATYRQRRMHRRVLHTADTAVATTPSSARAIAGIAARAGAVPRTACIYNGFDPDDYREFENAPPTRRDYGNGLNRYRLSFVGTLWKLNSIEPVVEAVQLLCAKAPALADQLELVCAGRKTAEQDAALDRLEDLPCHLVRLPFVDHSEALSLMMTADSLLMLLADHPGTNRIISAKTYEYMAAGRPVFLVAPEGDVCDVLRDVPGTIETRPGVPQEICDALALELERKRCGIDDGVQLNSSHSAALERFHRRHIASQMAALLDDVVDHQSRTNPVTANTVGKRTGERTN